MDEWLAEQKHFRHFPNDAVSYWLKYPLYYFYNHDFLDGSVVSVTLFIQTTLVYNSF